MQRKETKLIVLTRTTRRPNFFAGCIKSIACQVNSENIHLFISYEREQDRAYVDSELAKYPQLKTTIIKVNHVRWDKKEMHDVPIKTSSGQIIFHIRNSPYTLHLNELLDEAKKEYGELDIPVQYLDDDDCYSKTDSAKIIVDEFNKDNSKILMWLVDFHKKLVPEPEYWKRPPAMFHVSGAGFCHSLKYANQAIWDNKSCSDYRVISELVNAHGVAYVTDLLTKIQRKSGGGDGRMDDISTPLGKKQIFNYER